MAVTALNYKALAWYRVSHFSPLLMCSHLVRHYKPISCSFRPELGDVQRHTSRDKSFQAFPPTFCTAIDKNWVWRPGNEATILSVKLRVCLYSITISILWDAQMSIVCQPTPQWQPMELKHVINTSPQVLSDWFKD